MAAKIPKEYASHFRGIDNLLKIKRQENAIGKFLEHWEVLRDCLRRCRQQLQESQIPLEYCGLTPEFMEELTGQFRQLFLVSLSADAKEKVLGKVMRDLPSAEDQPNGQFARAEVELIRLALLSLTEISREYRGAIRLPQWDRTREQLEAELEAATVA